MAVKPGFRLGIYLRKDLEIVDFAAPYGVFSVARRFDPELMRSSSPNRCARCRHRPDSRSCPTTASTTARPWTPS